jgi:phosphatidylglycerophosphate synthase
MVEPRTPLTPAQHMLANLPASLAGRLAPGSADNMGILCCRLLALPVVEICIWLRIGPCWITTASNTLFFAGLAALGQGHERWAGVGVGVGALFDYADGMVARRTGRCSRIGFQYDYIMDRAKSAGLFLVVTYLSGDGLVRWLLLMAVGLLVAREVVSWLLPLRRAGWVNIRSPWQMVFGRLGRWADELLRNDPWQLVLLGLLLALAPASLKICLSYYVLTLAVDSWVFFRSYLNARELQGSQDFRRLNWGAEGRIKTSVARAWQGLSRSRRPTK